ncbi:MAG TPA: uroporphyrinogen decarboxylase family protein [Anaerolineaceae bacterium]
MTKPLCFFQRQPKPDSAHFIQYLLGKDGSGTPPLVEYLVDGVVMRPILTNLLGRQWVDDLREPDLRHLYLDNFIQFWYRLGYDFVRFERSMDFPVNRLISADPAPNANQERAWSDQHHGRIMSWQDFEQYPWPRIETTDFSAYEYLNCNLPDGMGLIVSHAGGMYEHLSQIMSYEGLCLALHENPDLVKAVSDRIGELMVKYYEHLLDLNRVIALFPGDDMGFRTSTLISPTHLRQYTLPWHKQFAGMAHNHGIPYFLHSCGNIDKIMPDLIHDVGIDGKHSFEDAIIPVEHFQEKYGSQIAVLGGVDVHLLTTGSPEQVQTRVRFLKETCGARGRFAIGSGNSIPSYIPVENYLAMVSTALEE